MELKLSNVQKLAIEEKKLQATNKKFSDTKTPPKNSLTEKPSTVSKSDSKSQFFGLDHIYILNMDRRKDRLRTMQRIFNKLNANFTRIPAIDKKSPEFLEMYRNFKNAGGQLYAAGYAIKVSHLKVLKDMEKNGYETVMVMEDDIDLDLRIGTLLPLMLKKLPVDWGIYFVTYSKNVTPYPTHNSLIYPLGRFVSGALALVYRKSVLQKVQEYAKLDNKEPWDYMLGEMFVRDDWFGIKGYASDFVLAEHMGSTPNNPSDNLDTPDLTWKTSYDAEELLSSTFFSLEN
ncbi:hypothetical protein HK099_002495 [Clydaea vesicula]|uniref:Glycosyl transferase family 25 domain-containing protein n=1 Tax=Clydaea vesicula TaxID=447962 RepID=A0AAD5TUY3_9FUNG|nr:hypothetical protein HK099_002495 [Clydaea vesicula]